MYASGFNAEELKICTDFDAATQWFYKHSMNINAGKCHFMCFGKDTSNESFYFQKCSNNEEKNNKEEKNNWSYYRQQTEL